MTTCPDAHNDLAAGSGVGCASAVAVEVVGARAEGGGSVVGVEEAAAVDGEAAAADAGGEPVAECLQGGDAPVDVGAPGAREAFPVAAARRASGGEGFERLSDLFERDTGGAPGLDKRDAAEGRARVAALVAAGAVGVDESLAFVEAEGGGVTPLRAESSPIVSSSAI
jgi:hypothetical protein